MIEQGLIAPYFLKLKYGALIMSNVNIDLSIQVKRFPDVQNYQVNLLLIKDGKPSEFETHVCQSLVEVFEKTQKFEQRYLTQFENAIEYQKTDWRELAAQNRAAQGVKK